MNHRAAPILVLFAALASFNLLTPARLAAADTKGAFQKLDLAAASDQARKEGKLVFVDAWATWCGPCKMLDASTWKDAGVIDLLKQHTVAIKIDVDQNPQFAVDRKITSIPTLLVLRPDGTEVTRIVGYVDAAAFKAQMEPKLVESN